MDAPAAPHIAVIGLGYVGLPLAVAFAQRFDVTGFDISRVRIERLRAGHDDTREVADAVLRDAARLRFTLDAADIAACDTYIVTVPTPIDAHKRPDLGPLLAACETVAGVLERGNLVVFESTVYPGATEEECVPVLEAHSGLRLNEDFAVGYSP